MATVEMKTQLTEKTKFPAKRITNRDRILAASVELFNLSGVADTSTNHIASHLAISPGNLYFHFQNKEEILRDLFKQMNLETYGVWKRQETVSTPGEMIERSLDVYWKYRFFHREMYHLRRSDAQLARAWRAHIKKTSLMMVAAYADWVKAGYLRAIESAEEKSMVIDALLALSSTFLQFYESREKQAQKKSLQHAIRHVFRVLQPYETEQGVKLREEYLQRYGDTSIRLN